MVMKLALRGTVKRITVVLPVTFALAAGLTVTTALFGIADGLLLRPLPFTDPGQLVALEFRPDAGGRPPRVAFAPDLRDRRDTLRVQIENSPLVVGAAQAGPGAFFAYDEAQAAGLRVHGVDARFFPLLGLRPFIGAGFTQDDEQIAKTWTAVAEGPRLPVLIGHHFWQAHYGGDPAVIDREHELAGRLVRVVGVMPPGVKFPGETNVWAPVSSTRDHPPAIVRLAPSATASQLASLLPDITVTPLREAIRPGGGRWVLVFLAAAALLLLLTCLQIAGLASAVALNRLPEMGVQLALGGGHWRLLKQVLIENAAVAGLAALLAALAVRPLALTIIKLMPAELRSGQYLEPDMRTFASLAAMAVLGVAGLASVPVAFIRKAAPLDLMRGRAIAGPQGTRRLRHHLLVAQVAVTSILVYLAVLAAHSYARAITFDYGFDANRVVVFTPPAWAAPNLTVQQLQAAFAEHQRKSADSVRALAASPRVSSAAALFGGPLGLGTSRVETVRVTHFNGRPVSDTSIEVRVSAVGSDFVGALGARLIAGRTFTDPDYATRENIAVVNETLARRLLPGVSGDTPDLLGTILDREIRMPTFGGRIVGVVKDLVQTSPEVPAQSELFAHDPRGRAALAIAARVSTSHEEALPELLGRLQPIWGDLEPRRFTLFRDELERVVAPYRAQSLLLGAIALLCVPIAGVGLAGAVAHAVRLRRHEMAVRLALGAEAAAVKQAIVRDALRRVAFGLAIGSAAGVVAARLIASQLFQVQPLDALALLTGSGSMLLLGWVAASVPARQVARIAPAEVLKADS